MIPLKLGLQQRMFPSYRRGFFELLGQSCDKGFSLFAGDAEEWEHVNSANILTNGEYVHARNLHMGSGKLYLCYQRNLMDWVREWDPDALILEANPRYLSSRLAMRWMKQRNRPIIGWGLGAPQGGNPVFSQIWKNFTQQFDANIAYSHNGKQDYIDLGIPQEQIFVAPNAVLPAPTHTFQPKSISDQVNILYVGRLQARKKVDELIQVCGQYAHQGEQLNLVIVGDGPEKENLQTLAQNVFPAAKFTGALHGKEAQPYFEQADLFVLPGTGGLAVQEALSYGLPVVVAEADGTQSNMVQPENGWVIDPGDSEGLVNALGQALSAREKLPQMGKVSFDIASQKVNINQMVKVFEESILYASKKRK